MEDIFEIEFTHSVKNCLSDSDSQIYFNRTVLSSGLVCPPTPYSTTACKQHTLLIWATLLHKSSYITENSYIKCRLLGEHTRVEREREEENQKHVGAKRWKHKQLQRGIPVVLTHVERQIYRASPNSWLVFKWSYIKVNRYGAHQYSLPFYGKSRICLKRLCFHSGGTSCCSSCE